MPEFGDFGERSPEEIQALERAQDQIGGSGTTIRQMDRLLESRSAELPDDADDFQRRNHYVLQDSKYETAVKEEYELLLAATEAVAKYHMSTERTDAVRTTLEDEASRLLGAANRIALGLEDISPADFNPEV